MSDSLWPHGTLQARILEWVAVPFSRGSSQPRDRTQVSRIAGRFFTSWATKEAPKKELSFKKKMILLILGPEYSTDQKYIFKKCCFGTKEKKKKKKEGRAQHQN